METRTEYTCWKSIKKVTFFLMPPVVIHWMLSSYTGWGVYGTNLALEWMDGGELFPLTSHEIVPSALALDGLRRARLERCIAHSRALRNDLAKQPRGSIADISIPVLQPMGNGPLAPRNAHDVFLRGKPSIGVIFFEDTRFSAGALAEARTYPLIVTGSRWNEELLRAAGVERVRTVLQGIDPTLFHPAPRTGWFRDRFVIFSGGKLEARKGQDLVLRAFAAFAQRHPESLLVTAWHSPWPQFALDFGERHFVAPVPFANDGAADVKGWAAANGIDPASVVDIGSMPNAMLPAVLREADVALFPHRAEGGTNLVAMEAMACGVPCILSRNTGHRDLIGDANCYALERQTPVAGEGHEGWGESDVDEIVETLEHVWRDRGDAAARGMRGAAAMASLSWSAQAAELRSVVTALL